MKIKNKMIIVLTILFSFAIISLFFIYIKKIFDKDIVFKLNEPINQEVSLGKEYEEYGATVLVSSNDRTSEIKIDTSKLDIGHIGTYKIRYYIVLDNREYNYYRYVTVVDRTPPEIKLTGGDTTILLNSEYKELGYIATDNYDGDITSKVKVTNDITTNKVGEYKVSYEVSDTSNNSTSITRKVFVKKPNKVITNPVEENKIISKKVDEISYTNTIKKNKFTSKGFYIEGYLKNSNGTYILELVGDNKYSFDMIKIDDNNYKGDINLDSVVNGTYELYINSNNEEKLLNKLDYLDKIVRAKVGSKLVIFNYNEDYISVTIGDFSYSYDILIDVGHGGNDPGAVNEYIQEKELNLIVSKYEKCRYESMGYRVYLTRSDNSYGVGYGQDNIKQLYRRALEIGYYGTVSKIIYSNHHNSIGNNYFSGYEIIVPASLSNNDMNTELNIKNKFDSLYSNMDNHVRFYTRDYDKENIVNKLDGSIYSFRNYYAVIRIPYELFNIKSVIYEGTYLSNKNDFNWYFNQSNWIKVSEVKIEEYVKSLGGNYISDNNSCL